jgi:hypothetical protein
VQPAQTQGCAAWFVSDRVPPAFTKDKSQIVTSSLKNIHFFFPFWAPFAFGETYFHKIKGKETQ